MNVRILSSSLTLVCLLTSASLGNMVITELMVHPQQTPVNAWEWVEIFNNGANYTTAAGDFLGDQDTGAGALLTGVMIKSGTYAVLMNGDQNTAAAFKSAWNLGVNDVVIPVTSWQRLANGGDDVVSTIATSVGGVVDTVNYIPASFPETKDNGARSIEFCLDPNSGTAHIDNDDGNNWSNDSPKFESNPAGTSNTTAFGTPGAAKIPEPSAFAFLGLIGVVAVGMKRFWSREQV